MAQKSRRYAAIFYACLLITIVLIGTVLFSDENEEHSRTVKASTTTADMHITLPATTIATSSVTSTTASSSTAARMVICWTEKQLVEVFSDALSFLEDDAQINEAKLEEPDRVTLTGKFTKESIEELITDKEGESGVSAKLALKLAPSTIELSITCTVAAENGSVVLTLDMLTLNDVTLPASILPTQWEKAINNSLRSELEKQHCTALDLSIEDSLLHLDCEMGA